MSDPRLLICGFRAFPAAPRNPAAAVVEALDQARWSPPGVATSYLTLPVAWRGSAEAVAAHLSVAPADAILVVGVAVEALAFRVETLAHNGACATSLDHNGELWSGDLIAQDSLEQIAATAPVEAMAAAIKDAGLPTELSTDAGDYLCNFTLYRLLTAQAAPAVGFLHVPQARECADDAVFDLADITLAVQTAAGAFATHLRTTRP